MTITEKAVYELLSRLNDSAYLHGHPLASLIETQGMQRGQALRQLLLELMELLKPPVGTDYGDPAWRPYQVLRLRYLEQRSPYKVQEATGLSERQVRREQRRGIEALTHLLADALADSAGQTNTEPASQETFREAMQVFEVNPTELDAVLLLREVAQTVEPLLRSSGTRLSLEPAQSSTIYADRITLRQILLHIVSAIVECAGGGSISLSLEATRNNACLSFSTRCPDDREELLADEVVRECNALAELSSGLVWQEVSQGQGIVRCLLPARKPLLLLLVDDEPTAERLIRRCLQGCGVQVTSATEAEEATNRASLLQPDVITLDVLMPKRDGWEVLQQLRAAPKTQDIPIIVCSVWKEPELALALGANEFIRKPVTRHRLIEALRRVLPSESADRFLPEPP